MGLFQHGCLRAGLAVCICCSAGFSLRAQDAVRLSLGSAQAAEARRKANSTLGYYNVKIGPTGWRFASSLGLEWSDNIRLTADNPLSDFSFLPAVQARMVLPVSEGNTLNLAFGGGYQAYLEHNEYNRWFVTPGSELSFDLYVGELWINLHDRFSITDDTYEDPTVVGVGGYSRLENVVGSTATWDLNEAVARLEYNHATYVTLSGDESSQPDGNSDLASASFALQPSQDLLAGLEVGGGAVRYEETQAQSLNNYGYTHALQWNAGLFADWTVSEHLKARGSVGYMQFTPQDGTIRAEDFSGLYAQLGVNHRVNEHVTATVQAGRQISFTFYGGTIDLYYARLGADWKLFQKTSVNTGFEAEYGQYLVTGGEEFTRLGPSLRLGRRITEKLNGSLAYRFYWRDSDRAYGEYTVNVVSLTLQYQF